MKDEHLKTYLSDHLAGSVMGIELAERCLANNAESSLGTYLKRFLANIEEDQAVLKDLLERLGGGGNPLKTVAAWFAEKASRVKLNNRLLKYSDLSRLEELEGLLLGVRGKLALWTALKASVAADARFSNVHFDDLVRRAEEQLGELERHRLAAARQAFSPDAPVA